MQSPVNTRGLAVSVAMARAFVEQDQDIFDAFLPVVLDSVGSLECSVFDKATVCHAIEERFGLIIPEATIGTFLNRARARHFIERIGGAYQRIDGVDWGHDEIQTSQVRFSEGIRELCTTIRESAAESQAEIDLDDDSLLGLVLRLLHENQLGILLDEKVCLLGSAPTSKEDQAIARCIVEQLSNDQAPCFGVLMGLVEGTILEEALSLTGLDQLSARLGGLRVFLDTGLLLGVLGYHGPTEERMVNEFKKELQSSGAQCLVLPITCQEVDSILSVYERMLGTTADRFSLRQSSPVTRHFLDRGVSSADVIEYRALLQQNLRALDIQVFPTPDFVPDLPFDFDELARILASHKQGPDSPRVNHDTDCIRAVLTLRRGEVASTIARTKALFCTSTALVVSNGRKWYRSEGGQGLPPVIHYQSLSSRLWLRNPRRGRQLKKSEAIARFSLLLRPSQRIWEAFGRYLNKLRQDGRIDDFDALLALSDSYSERFLAAAEVDCLDKGVDPDATTFAEVIQRVQTQYREEGRALERKDHAEELMSAEKEKHRLEENVAALSKRHKDSDLRLEIALRRNKQLARRIARYSAYLLVGIPWAVWICLFIYSQFFVEDPGWGWPRVVALTGGILSAISGWSDVFSPSSVAAWLEGFIRTHLTSE